MSPKPRILIVDDNPHDRLLVIRELSREFPELQTVEVRERGAFDRALEDDFDLVITDYQINWIHGLDVLRAVKARHPDRPVIMFTGTGSEEIAVQAMKEGLDDYVIKSPRHLIRLAAAAHAALERAGTRQHAARVENRLQSLLNRLNMGVFRTTLDGHLLESNPALHRLLGIPEHADQRVDLSNLFENPNEHRETIERLQAGEQHVEHEARVRRPDGHTIWVLVNTALLAADEGLVVDGLMEDITARKRLEDERAELLVREQAARAEAEAAIRARDVFLSAAAHELKTPITSLRGFSQTNLRRLDKTGTLDLARVRRAFETIDQQSEKLERLVEQLLDVSRIESGRLVLHPEVTDLVRLVEAVVAAARARTNRHTIAIHAPNPLLVSLDPLRIEQVLVNLLDNAARFSPNGGPIDIEIGKGEAATVHLSVTDPGIGISPDQRQRIFDRFYQAATPTYLGGLGLGLFVSRHIVELHGGRLEVEAPVEGGTRFVISLPAGLAHALDAREAEQG